jgi:hypothetical protein
MSSLRPAGHRLAGQQVVEDGGGDRDPLGGGHGVAAERVGEVEAVHHRLHHPAGHELVQPHEGVVPGTDGVGGQRPGPETVLAKVAARVSGIWAGVLPSTMV